MRETLFNDLDNAQDRMLKNLGAAVICLTSNNKSYKSRLSIIKPMLQDAISTEQIDFLLDSHGRPVGFYTWAYLDPDIALRYITDKSYRLHPSEWNEGIDIWIISVCCADSLLSLLKKKIALKFCTEHTHIHWLRRKAKSRIAIKYRLDTNRATFLNI